jgi:hypothetical protein
MKKSTFLVSGDRNFSVASGLIALLVKAKRHLKRHLWKGDAMD